MKIKKGIESFIEKIGSMLEISKEQIKLEEINSNYSNKYSPEEQNAKAIRSDLINTGQDLNYAIIKFEKDYINKNGRTIQKKHCIQI
jgi:hypothetical protein